MPAYSAAARGALRGRAPRRGPRGAAPLRGRDRSGGPVERPDVYRALGRGEMRAGRSLESLLSAYRIGARVAWRRFAAAGAAAQLQPDTLYLLAESLFAYIDVLSAESAEGHALEQSAAASEAQLRRRRLVRMLVREPPRRPHRGGGRGRRRRLGAAAHAGGGGHRRRAARGRRLAPAAGHDQRGDRRAHLRARRRPRRPRPAGRAGARGGRRGGARPAWARPSTGSQARISFGRARAALELTGDQPALVRARENAGELLLRADPGLALELAADRLAPLADLSPGSRRRLTETLEVWLAEQGRLGQVAERLEIHPQTARYRLGRLRELFGRTLEDPDARFWLALALRVAPADGSRAATSRLTADRGGAEILGRRGLGLVGPAPRDRASRRRSRRPSCRRSAPGTCRGCGRGTRSSRGRPSSGTRSVLSGTQVIWVIL